MNFIKMQGLGNDFIFIEDKEEKLIYEEKEIAKKICNRKFGVGADGLVIIRNSTIADAKMVIINSDGSDANMCGNAIRCFAKYLYEINMINKKEISIETGDGIKYIELIINKNKVSLVKVNMGGASFKAEDVLLRYKDELINKEVKIDDRDYKITSLLLGVPHTILINNEDKYSIEDGKVIEKSNLFINGTNVNLVKRIDENNIEVETWERGAGATLACGTGCCASVVALNKLGMCSNNVKVSTLGGELEIKIEEEKIYMIGNAEFIFKGELLY